VSASSQTRTPLALVALTFLLLFLSLGAFYGGSSMLLNPESALGMPASWLREHSPFTNYLIPGTILFALFGIGSLIVVIALWIRPDNDLLDRFTGWTHEHWSWGAAVGIGVAQMVWIIVQAFMMQRYHPLQPTLFIVGLLIATLPLLPEMRRYYH
jgi:hypothetical protein